jgi:outer membrane receptor protein involved in Fe transport
LNNKETDGYLLTQNAFYKPMFANDSIDQKKVNSSVDHTQNAKLIYTEPITQKIKLEFEYSFNYASSVQDKKAQNFENNEYRLYDSSLTNNFETKSMINRVGLKFIHEAKKQSFNFGSRYRNVEVDNTNLINDGIVRQSINNVLPFLGYTYRFNQNAQFNFRYSTSSTQPSISQLQPTPDNNNPNQIVIGNPHLLPTYSNKVSITYNSYKPITRRYIYAKINLNLNNNDFVYYTSYDSIGRSITQTRNVNGNKYASSYVGGSLPLYKKILSISPHVSYNYNHYVSFINTQRNITQQHIVGSGMSADVELDTLTFSVGYNYTHYTPVSSLNLSSSQPYFQQQFNSSVMLKLPHKMIFESDVNYTINSKRAQGYNLHYAIWNASISKVFLKNENLIFSFKVNDILNKNISNERVVQDNIITDKKVNIISRYILLKLTYKLNSTRTKDNDDFF